MPSQQETFEIFPSETVHRTRLIETNKLLQVAHATALPTA